MSKFAVDVVLAFSQSVPLVYLATPDQPAAERAIVEALVQDADERGEPVPAVWHVDAAFGLEPLTEAAREPEALGSLTGDMDVTMFADPLITAKGIRPVVFENKERGGMPPRSVLLWWDADAAWSKQDVPVALLRCRDALCADDCGAMVVGIGTDPGKLPALIAADVHVIRDPYPGEAERRAEIVSVLKGSKIKADESAIVRASGLTSGLTMFQAVQAAALASADGSLDLDVMGQRAREMLGGLPGITIDVPEPPEFFAGLPAIVSLADRLVRSIPIRLVVLLDEAEKVVSAGDGARDGGASGGVFKALLTHLTAPKSSGVRSLGVQATGVPGTGKSTLARVIASLAGCLIVMLDPESMKSEYVGASKQRAEQALSAIRAFGGNHLWIATSNRTHGDQGEPLFREEWRSRFALGTWFFDAPTPEQLAGIWAAQLRKGGRDAAERWTDDNGWTGRDVADVIALANDLQCPIAEIAAEHVPSLRTMGAEVDARRKIASLNSYRDAATGRPYQLPGSIPAIVAPSGPRRIGPAARTVAPVTAPPPPAPAPAAPSDEDTF